MNKTLHPNYSSYFNPYAGYFLAETLAGFNEKFTSTTIETRSVQQFPFPAVTFYPGDYNSENAFLRTFLNQFQFTRYKNIGDHPNELEENEVFIRMFEWLISPMNKRLFEERGQRIQLSLFINIHEFSYREALRK